ncbi:phage gp6-like head-tail connector protein [Priestia flexa]|uniref:phage gp6-like head-tail connector protein n=1 Tax=Priestia flexa TaxID=86664 RepID=UPI001F4CDFA0|nr:phage gp6-like head-tail connector protein [Priestia flexa]
MDITEEVLTLFKERMHITHSSEDNTLKELLQASYEDIKSKCGVFAIDTSYRGRELVFERTRYVYNDAIEYFDTNFLSMINSFSIDNLPVEVDTDEGV